MEIKEIKEKYGQDLCLMGNIDPRLLSRDGGSDALPGSAGFHELARAVQELIVVAAPSSGFIFGTCSGLHAGLSPQKVNFMYSMLKNDIINNDPVLKLF
jgi:uroporphyrinogen-III decarboxylase